MMYVIVVSSRRIHAIFKRGLCSHTQVPINLYFMTHAYFCLYHTLSNYALRRLWRAFGNRVTVVSFIAVSIVIGLMSVFTAFTETFTIQNFPYYELACRWEMYTYGSVFYGLYFIVSYPMFLRIDERPTERWTFFQAFVEGMAVSMLITTGKSVALLAA